eukprot:604960-Rhodomonas_salina.2
MAAGREAGVGISINTDIWTVADLEPFGPAAKTGVICAWEVTRSQIASATWGTKAQTGWRAVGA